VSGHDDRALMLARAARNARSLLLIRFDNEVLGASGAGLGATS